MANTGKTNASNNTNANHTRDGGDTVDASRFRDQPDGIIERLNTPSGPEEETYRNMSAPDDNLVQGPPIGTGQPGDASGPDIWGNDSGPLQAPRDQSESAQHRAAPGTMGIPGINNQGSEGNPTSPHGQDYGYMDSGGGLGGADATAPGNTTAPALGRSGVVNDADAANGATTSDLIENQREAQGENQGRRAQ